MAYRAFVTVWNTFVYYKHWRGGSINFNSPRGDITMPGMALAKGNPLYRVRIHDEVTATVVLRAQFLLGRFQPIMALNFTRRPEFPLFEEYFRTRTPQKYESIHSPVNRPYGF